MIATEKGWNLYVCGNGGMKPRHAELLASDLDKETLTQMGQLGFMGMLVSEQWGGSDTGNLAYVLALEEVAAADGAT
ncbi:acyl-CoA dehydrogenase family protein, partial [Acinetobacter nosocomialis]|uniref:acyl-CoA dehydrogenase family protein n=1 Tax=Acinetobacter nosocomialis TaxID=106654 RepID=UPI001D1914F3